MTDPGLRRGMRPWPFALAAALVGLGCASGAYFPAKDARAGDRLDRYMAAVMESRPIPGIAIGVVKGADLALARAYGVQDLQKGTPVTPLTVFHTASLSKTFTATAAMQLVEEGRLDLDAPVTLHLPYFRLADGRAGEITTRRILAHLSGMPADLEGDWWDSPETDAGALERYVRRLADQRLSSDTDGEWKYSNMAYNVLGDVIAKVSGVSFEERLRARVLEPLGMSSSTFLPYAGDPGRLASPHRGSLAPRVSATYPYHRASAPSSTLKSCVRDLARWVAANLNGGRIEGAVILRKPLLESMWEPQAKVDRGIRMGLGWFLRSHRGNRMVVSGARDPGFTAALAFLPDNAVGVVVLSNYDGQSSMEMVEIADGVLDVGLGRDPVVPKASVAVPVARALSGGGLEAAFAEYRRLKDADDGRYSFGMSDLITLGHELRLDGRLEDAIRFYALNAEERPDYFASHLALAQVYLKIGDRARAAESYRRVLAMKPEKYGCPPSCYREPALDALVE